MIAQQFTPVGTDIVWASMFANGDTVVRSYPQRIVRTTDGGKAWQDVTPPGLAMAEGDKYILSADFHGVDDAWVTYGGIADGSPQFLVSTADGGQHWSKVGRLPSPYCEVQFVSATDGWCVAILAAMGSEQVIIDQTTDGGGHWRLVSKSASPVTESGGSPGSLPLAGDKKVTFLNASEGWAGYADEAGRVGSVSPLFETTDAGRSWFDVAIAPLPSGYISVNGVPATWVVQPVLDGNNGAAALSVDTGGHVVSLVYRSSDGGKAWQPAPSPGRPRDWWIDLVNATQWKLVSGHLILSTNNAGRSWQTVHSELAFATAPDFVTSAVGWYPGNDASVEYRTTNGGATWARVALPRAQA